MASELCMNCFSVKGQYEICPFCGYAEGTPPAQPHYLMPGTILANHFIVGTAIGFGGFGITYKCFDTMLGVIVAVKEFYPAGLVNRAPGESSVGLLSGDRREQYHAQLKRFLMEAQSIAQFGKAKDIVNVYDFFEANNTAYIIMEYVDGVLLKDYLDRQGKMEPDVALQVITPIVEAVKKIHAKGIIHRDISPDNIFIADEKSIKVFDFGAAELNESSEGMAGEKVIKVGYSAPEQYRDSSQQGFYTDIYSVGAILYQMLTGIKPVESTEREFKDTLKSPAELGVKLEPNVDRAVMEALAVRPELRFQSIQHFDDALHSKRIAEYPKTKLKKRRRRRNWIISLAAALVLAVAVSIGLFSTVLKEESRIFDTTLQKDTITIWVNTKEQKDILDFVAKNNFIPTDTLGKTSERVRAMLENNKDITVSVVNIKEENRDATMEDKLRQAKGNGSMPDMFITDDIVNLKDFSLTSLEGNVLAEINPEEYLYMSEYGKYFPDMTEMPTGINSLMLYSKLYRGGDSKNNSTFYDQAEKSETIELGDIEKRNQEETEHTYIPGNGVTLLSILDNPDCFDALSGTLKPDDALAENLGQYLAISGNSEKIKNSETLTDYGNSTISDTSYRKYSYQFGQSEVIEGEGKVEDCNAAVVTKDDRMLVWYDTKFAINAETTENKKTACMRFLWIMLGKSAQENYYKADSVSPFPINKEAFETTESSRNEGKTSDFFDYNPTLACFRDRVVNRNGCLLLGRGLGRLRDFDNRLREHLKQGGSETEEKIRQYCRQYAAEQKEQ